VGTAVGASLKRASGPEGAFEYEVVEGARYLVGAIGPGFDGSLREVDVPRGKDRVVVDLHAQDLGELALLSVRVFHRGHELDGGMDEDPFALQLEGREGNVLLSVPCDVLRAPFQLRAPAGDYRLVVEGRAGTNFPHGYVERVRLLGRCERVLRLVAGDRQEVELEIGEGAKLEVTLVGQAEDADVRAAWEGASPGARMEEVQDREAERRSALAQLYLVADDRRREPVLLLTRAMEGTSAGGLHLLDQWPLGETSVSECLSAGRHTLIARLPGGREARAEVDLREGRTTPVRLRF
jgi:hypothetical protein